MKQIVLAAGASLILMGCSQPSNDASEVTLAITHCQSLGVHPQSPAFAVCVDKLVEDKARKEDRDFRVRTVLYVAAGMAGLLALAQIEYWLNPNYRCNPAEYDC